MHKIKETHYKGLNPFAFLAFHEQNHGSYPLYLNQVLREGDKHKVPNTEKMKWGWKKVPFPDIYQKKILCGKRRSWGKKQLLMPTTWKPWKKNRLSLSIRAYPLQSEGFTLRWVMGLEKIINNAINLRLFFNLFKKYTFIFNKCKVM